MRAAFGASIGIAVIAATAIVALPFWNAAALILRAAGTPGLLGRLAAWDARRVTDSIEYIDTRTARLRARVFRPSGRAQRAVLLITGVHPDGIDDPRLLDLAKQLAATGVNVVTPEIVDLKEYRLTASVTDAIEDAAVWSASRPDLGSRAIGMIGVSFSGGLSIVAAGRPSLHGRVAYVLSFGGHGNLPRVLRYLCTGVEPAIDGRPSSPQRPHDYAVAIVLHQAADFAVPSAQVADLRRGIDMFLLASSITRTDRSRADQITADAWKFVAGMPEPSATLMRFVLERNVEELGKRLAPFLDRLGQDPSLSPDRSPAPAAPVYLLHGRDDNVIPPVESALLESYLAKRTRVRRLESAFLSHVDVAETPTFGDAWDMIRFWQGALGEE